MKGVPSGRLSAFAALVLFGVLVLGAACASFGGVAEYGGSSRSHAVIPPASGTTNFVKNGSGPRDDVSAKEAPVMGDTPVTGDGPVVEDEAPADRQSLTDDTATEPRVYKIVGYVTSWSVYGREFRLADIDGGKYTHLIYAFAQIGDDDRIALFDPNADVVKSYGPEPQDLGFRGNFSQLVALKEKFPHLKTLISVGGWTRSSAFSRMAAGPESRAAFVDSVLTFLEHYHFDGVDLDWEYPVEGGAAGNEHRPDDAGNLSVLVRDLRTAFDAHASEGGQRYQISLALSPNPRFLAHLDLAALSENSDFLNLMAYNYATVWSSTAQHQAPLAASGNRLSIESSIRYCLDNGLTPAKLVLGIPAYGRGLSLEPNIDPGTSLGSKTTAAPPSGTWEGASFDYRHIVHGIDEKRPMLARPDTAFWDEQSEAPFIYYADSGLFISYDDPRSVQAKSLAVWRLGLGGVMFWELSSDPGAELAAAAATVLGSPPSEGTENVP